MKFFTTRRNCYAALPLLGFVMILAVCSRNIYAANIGTIVPVVGQIVDMAHDAKRNLLYLAIPSRNEVGVYSVDKRQLEASIMAGVQPASMAFSPDGDTLYVTSLGSLSISAIDLNLQQSVGDYYVGSRPDAIAVGNDGIVVILGTTGLLRLNPLTKTITPVPISPPATPAAGAQAALRTAASGSLIIGISGNRLFVYEVASGSILRSRNVAGMRALLSASADGSRFMAGPFLFDTQTLTILGITGTLTGALTGGSAFAVDGSVIYASFSTQPPINPLNTNNPQNTGGAVIPGAIAGQITGVPTRGVLQIMRYSSLAPQLGLRLAETIISRIISSADGQNLFTNCSSGLQVIPIGQLSRLPVLEVSNTNVVLSEDMCNRTVVTASVQVRNAGGGRMTFASALNNAAAPVILSQRSGVASTTLNISYDPRAVTAFGTVQYAAILVSPEAVNIEPAILISLNHRDVSHRGAILPMTGVGVDLLMDSVRNRLYIANYTQDQIEVFSPATQSFLAPIRVGNRPVSMAQVDASTLVISNGGAEYFSVVNLDTMQEIDKIPMAPVPLNATPLFPRSVAASTNAILFSAVPLPATPGVAPGNGSVWQLSLVTRTAFPRLDLGTGVTNSIMGRNLLVAPADGSGVLLVEGNGNLRLYDPIVDSFPASRTAGVSGLRGTATAAANGSFYVVDNTVLNSVLGTQGTIGTATGTAALAFGVASSGSNVVRVQAPTGQTTVQGLQLYSLSTLQSNLQVLMPEPIMDITPAQIGTPTSIRQWPPRSVAMELGISNQTLLLPRGMAMDNANNAYALTVSGISVVAVKSAAGKVPAFLTSGVVNSASLARGISPGSLITIFGTNLADPETASTTSLPTSLGGVCVTANEVAIPLRATSPTQIDAQLPPNQGVGRVTLTVRSTRLGVVSPGVQVPVVAASPGAFSMDISGASRAALFHAEDSMLVTPDYPADRDEHLILYATGLGPASPQVSAGQPASEDPQSLNTLPVQVFIGGHSYKVISSRLAPGLVGVSEIRLYVPGDRVRGTDLPVVITVGGASSPSFQAPLAAIR